jgi:hypothetical protein
MNETQLGEAVRSSLNDATAGLTIRPDAALRARRQGRRRRTVRGLLAGVPALALVAAGTAFAMHGSTAPAATTPKAVTAAYVVTQAKAALSQADQDIVQIEIRLGDYGSNITLADPETGNSWQMAKSPGGTFFQWYQPYKAGSLDLKVTFVDMSDQDWWTGNVREVKPGSQGSSSAFEPSPFSTPQQIRQALSNGAAEIAGKGRVNGHEAIDLRVTAQGTTLNYWVDATTYQPVQMDFSAGGKISIAWLPRTESLVNQVNTVHIPAGFRHVSAPDQ